MEYVKYLAYGSNLHPERIRRRVAHLTVLGTTPLAGWSLRFHKLSLDGSGKCNLVQVADDVAYGAVYEMSMQSKLILDDIEGVGRGYEERRMTLNGFGKVYFYAATADHIDDTLRPYEWYKALVLAGLRHHGAPATYIDRMEAIPSVADHDVARVNLNQQILDALVRA